MLRGEEAVMLCARSRAGWTAAALALLALGFPSEPCRAQGLVVEAGWNNGVDTAARNLYPGQRSETGIPWSLSLYHGRALSGNYLGRMGLTFTRQVVEVMPRDPDGQDPAYRKGYRYRSGSLLFSVQRILQRGTRGRLLVELAAGGTSVEAELKSGRERCDTACLPDVGWRLLAGLGLAWRVTRDTGLQLSVRRDLVAVRSYPFVAGASVTLGIVIEPE